MGKRMGDGNKKKGLSTFLSLGCGGDRAIVHFVLTHTDSSLDSSMALGRKKKKRTGSAKAVFVCGAIIEQ